MLGLFRRPNIIPNMIPNIEFNVILVLLFSKNRVFSGGVGRRDVQLQQRSTLQGGAHENGLKQTNVRSDVRSRVRSGNQT